MKGATLLEVLEILFLIWYGTQVRSGKASSLSNSWSDNGGSAPDSLWPQS